MYYFKFGRLVDLDHEIACIRDIRDRYRHTYILGTTGTGKTSLMLRMALYDIEQGLACIFIDPKGEHAMSTDLKIDGKMIKNGQEQRGKVDGAPSRSLARPL